MKLMTKERKSFHHCRARRERSSLYMKVRRIVYGLFNGSSKMNEVNNNTALEVIFPNLSLVFFFFFFFAGAQGTHTATDKCCL